MGSIHPAVTTPAIKPSKQICVELDMSYMDWGVLRPKLVGGDELEKTKNMRRKNLDKNGTMKCLLL
jgi:hypothetical protein